MAEKGWAFRRSKAIQLDRMIGSKQTEQRDWSRPPSAGGGGNAKMFLTPGGGIAARSGTTVSSATCTEYKLVSGMLTTNTDTATVYNPWPVAIAAGYYIMAQKEQVSGEWIALFPGVINVRWADPDLEQTLDGTNYSNIDTAEAC